MLTLDAVPLDKLFKAKKIGEALALVKRVLEQLPRAIEQAIKV